jgi:hypothetical protein
LLAAWASNPEPPQETADDFPADRIRYIRAHEILVDTIEELPLTDPLAEWAADLMDMAARLGLDAGRWCGGVCDGEFRASNRRQNPVAYLIAHLDEVERDLEALRQFEAA